MMLNLMEQFPLGEYGFHTAKSLHVMIEAKKLAYADMLRYAGDPRFGDAPVAAMLRDRKSTRLNSSHITISYAVFCLKKKKTIGELELSGRILQTNAMWIAALQRRGINNIALYDSSSVHGVFIPFHHLVDMLMVLAIH